MKKKENNLKTIWYFLNPYKIYFVFLFFLCIIIGILETVNVAVLYPILTYSLDEQSTQSSNFFFILINNLAKTIPTADPLIANCILFIILALLSFLFGITYVLISTRITSKIVKESKQKLFNKYTHSDYQFFVDNKQGDLLYNISRAPSFITSVLQSLTKMFVDIILSISIFILLLSISLTGTIIIMVGGVGYYVFTKYLSLRVSYITGTGRYKASTRENVIVNEFINGIKQIKVFKTHPYWRTQFNKAVNDFWKLWRKDTFWLQTPGLMLNMLMFSSIVLVVIIIKIQNPVDFVSLIPVFGTFAFAAFKVIPKLASFGTYRMQIMSALPNVEVVHAVLKDESYTNIKNGTEKFIELNSGIELKNVKFAYKKRGEVLHNVSLKMEKGKMTAIVGASGSGKSTIVDLLLRLYDVDEGGMYIDDKNIKEYDIATFLEKTGFVSQDTFIHNASIRDNVAFGNEYTEHEIVEAAKLADAHEFVQQFPEKYDTLVGDRGVKLSGGQKQRIAIARAMIRKPEILILDEATSSLDNVSENIVQKAIDKVSKKCTTLIIAHRLSTIQNADVIYVLNQGKIVECGTHDQLMNQKGEYWNLYNIQIQKE
jgi:ABC-type multidrug transport system fused ATPase/permease subunit